MYYSKKQEALLCFRGLLLDTLCTSYFIENPFPKYLNQTNLSQSQKICNFSAGDIEG